MLYNRSDWPTRRRHGDMGATDPPGLGELTIRLCVYCAFPPRPHIHLIHPVLIHTIRLSTDSDGDALLRWRCVRRSSSGAERLDAPTSVYAPGGCTPMRTSK